MSTNPLDTFDSVALSLLKSFVWPMLWQSSLLVLVVFLVDYGIRQKVRPAVRYGLWLVVLLKLVLPPSLALPSGLSWWVRPSDAPPVRSLATLPVVINYSPGSFIELPAQVVKTFVAPPRRPAVSWVSGAFFVWGGMSFSLLIWMLIRWFIVGREARRASAPPKWLADLSDEARRNAGLRRQVRLRLAEGERSPALVGIIRPVILLPELLTTKLTPSQIRAVLLHELIHLRRGDVWVNCIQVVLQICYWWHPLVWFGNARIRRLREEAVDDAVVVALGHEADNYAPTLIEVARVALRRPLASLGLVGIMESKSSLRERIERLIASRPQCKAGATLVSAISILAFAAVAVPMGRAPASADDAKSGNKEALAANDAAPGRGPGPASGVQRTNRLADARRYFGLGDTLAVRATVEELEAALHALGAPAKRPGDKADFLYDRTIKVDPNLFLSRWQRQYPAAPVPSQQQLVTNYFAGAGLIFLPPREITFDPSHGVLKARAAREELDRLEQILSWNTPKPLINIRAKFIELSQQDALAFWQARSETNSTAGSPPACILTDPEARRQLRDWQESAELLNEASVTTEAGRRTEVQCEPGDIAVFTNWSHTGVAPAALTPPGPTLDITPYVSSDGLLIQLNAAASALEFLGFDVGKNGTIPKLRLNTVRPAPAVVWDHQTFVIGGLENANIRDVLRATQPTIAVGDHRVLGTAVPKRSLLLFITTAIIDPAGNVVHSEDQMPFAQNAVPPQEPFAPKAK